MNVSACFRSITVLACLALMMLAVSAVPARAAEGDHVAYLPAIIKLSTLPDLPFDPSATYTGDGTYYDATGWGNCSIDPVPGDLMVAAMNNTQYYGSMLCGAYVEVSGPKGTIVVRIVDRCPECAPGDIDLSREAFALIADPVAGRVPISWKIVSPLLSGPIAYRFKEGSSQWWTAVQVRNHRNPIYKLEYLDDDGVFREVPRELYNYFVEESGMGPGPYTFRVTDIYGHTLIDSGVVFVEGGEVAGDAQFPAEP